MATADHMTQAGTVRREPSHRTWFVAAIIVLLVLAVVFGALWLLERDSAASLEGDLTTAEQTIGTLEADVAALEGLVPVPHEAQVEVQALYDRFLLAIQDPKADEITAMFTPAAIHVSANGSETVGAAEIGEGWVDVGPVIVDDPGELVINGYPDGSMVAAMQGTVSGIQGLLVTRIANWGGEPNFSYMLWFGR